MIVQPASLSCPDVDRGLYSSRFKLTLGDLLNRLSYKNGRNSVCVTLQCYYSFISEMSISIYNMEFDRKAVDPGLV